ncbi:tetratricopeptide repeat protein, partial [Brachyspira intermedia]|uniref:tetratricopeptide repeat protein n=1 Tax=Brachyspira intermedia TaxID=84377 RepID=UPI003005ACE5
VDAINKFEEVSSIIINDGINDMNNTNIESIENIGVCYSKLGQHEEAIKQFEKALIFIEKEEKKQLNEKEKENLELIKISTYTNKISSLFKLKFHEDIISFVSELLKKLENISYCDKNKVISDFYTYKGIAEYYLKNDDNAIESYQQAIKFNPYNTKAYNNIGIIYQDKNDKKESIKYFTFGVKFEKEEEYKMYIQTLSGYSFGLILKTRYQCLIFDFMAIFSDVDYAKRSINFIATHKVTKELSKRIRDFCNKYRNDNNNNTFEELLHRFTNPKKIPLGDYFCILPGTDKIGAKEYIETMLYLLEEANSKEHSNQENGLLDDALLSTFLFYDISREKNPYNLYENEDRKELRYCKYCNKLDTDLKNKSHIIPKSLGGNTIDEEECTTCNHETLRNTIEKDLGKYLAPLKTIYGIKGYDKIPKFKSKNGYIDHSSDTNKLEIGSNNIKFDNNGLPKYIELSLGEISMRNVYRMMVKMSIGHMTKKYIEDNFNNDIINFINQKEVKINLPPIITYFNKYFIPSKNQNENAFITTFYKKDKNNEKFPSFVSEFIFYNFCYVFIIPFAKNDIIDFADKKNFDYFYNKWHYSHKFNPYLIDCNDEKNTEVYFKINFEERNDD